MLSYYNLINKDDMFNKPLETWGLFKRNASSYVHDLVHSDQSSWQVRLIQSDNYPTNTHDYQLFAPSKGTTDNQQYKLDANPSNLKLCVRDPLHRYCSGLVMIQFDLEEPYNRAATMDPYFHNGGREEILNSSNCRNEQDIRYLYCWRHFLRMLNNSVYAPDNNHNKDFTFGESHLDPTLSLALLMPYVHSDMNVEYVDLRRWTEFTTQKLGIEETGEAFDKWNAPKLEKRRDKIAQPGADMFKLLKEEMPFFSKDARAYTSPQNWQPTFEDWLEPEARSYKFIQENPVINHQDTDTMNKLTDFLVEQLEDPYFLNRSEIVRRNFCDPELLELFPNRLSAAITNCRNKLFDFEMNVRYRRIAHISN